MQKSNYPKPSSHGTFEFGSIVIDSNFDSGNCSHAEKVNASTFNVWIGTDHPQNNYKTWFHFSVFGFGKGSCVTFKIKNMQNQSQLLLEGLVPVYREEGTNQWKRISQKIDTTSIQYNEGWIQWPFRHTFSSTSKVFFAIFYPWSLQENDKFFQQIKVKFQQNPNNYFHRTTLTNSLEGRPIQLITISSKKGINIKEEKIEDTYLFKTHEKPKSFKDKKSIIISARVHPGEVPSSHVLVGIIKYLAEDTVTAKLLLQQFVFYIIPILNPDGVYRGHYRTDTKGINLNRYYINPSPTLHSPIYAVKKLILHLHSQQRFFAFLDLHAHAGRKGMFIYGNSMNELAKQVDSCFFPKVLSMNNEDFEYEGSNFTQKNMYCKDRSDQVSKQGSGRVAIYKITKNPNCWTLQCNYNASRRLNVLQNQKTEEENEATLVTQELKKQILVNYKFQNQKQPKGFYTIATYYKLGGDICLSFLDLVNKNPISRIENPKNTFQSLENLKLNLAIALLRMAPNRFESHFKKIYYSLIGENEDITNRSLKALQFILIKKARIQNINEFIKGKDDALVSYPTGNTFKNKHTRNIHSVKINQYKNIRITKLNSLFSRQSANVQDKNKPQDALEYKNPPQNALSNDSGENYSEEQLKNNSLEFTQSIEKTNKPIIKDNIETVSISGILLQRKISGLDQKPYLNKVMLRIQDFKMIGIQSLRSSLDKKQYIKNSSAKMYLINNARNNIKLKLQELPELNSGKNKPSLSIATINQQPKFLKRISARQPFNDY